MFKLRKKLDILLLLICLVVTKPDVLYSQMVSLESDFSRYLEFEDSNYSYTDSYFNPCLNKIETCNGFSLVFNLSLVYQDMDDKTDMGYNYGRIVLFSTGGDSSYATGGIYLHQVNVRGENYLELALTLYKDIYLSKIYLNENANMRIGLVWDKLILKVYVDGNLYQNIDTPSKRPYLSLNYNPYKRYKLRKNLNGESRLVKVLFNDTSLESFQPYVLGSDSDYFLGCYGTKILVQTSTLNVDSSTYHDQCEKNCFNSNNQFMLVNDNQCGCIANQTKFNEILVRTDCTTPNVWSVYTVSNLRFDIMNKKFDIKADFVALKNPIEVGDPVGFRFSNELSENYLVYAYFNNLVKSSIGNSFVFYEFPDSGAKTINITALSLSDPSQSIQKTVTIMVNKIVDRQPMHSISLDAIPTSEKSIEANLRVTGGHPYTCSINYGDSSANINSDSTNRTSSFKLRYSYSSTGMYNISATCRSLTVNNSQVSDWTVIYLPNRTSSDYYTTFSNAYATDNFNQMIIPRPTNPESEINLQLPFAAASLNMKFTIVDMFDSKNRVDWIYTKKQAGDLVLKLKAKYLKNSNENLFQVQTNNIVIASYLIILEDLIDSVPQIKILSDVLMQNVPTLFEITLKRTSNTILKVDYGDGSLEVYTLTNDNPSDLNTPYSLKLNHTYSSSDSSYLMKVSVANHLSRQDSSIPIEFESSLPKFILTVQSNVTDITQAVSFKLSPITQASNIEVNFIKIIYDINSPNNFKLITNYVFDRSNAFSLVIPYKYSSYGFFNVLVNCSNTISYNTASTSVRVGLNLNTASGLIVNNYANIQESIYVRLNVNGGNGYNILVAFGDSNKMLLPWSYLNSNGQKNDLIAKSDYVTPKAIFNQSGIYVMYEYQTPGEYEIVVNVSNPFGSLIINFCTKILIQSEPKPASLSIDSNCVVNGQNLGLFLNNVSMRTNNSFNIAKGIHNTLSIDFSSCLDPSLTKLATIWVFNSIPMGKTIDYEESISKYCMMRSATNALVIEPNELEFGLYSLKAYAYNPDQPENYVFISNYRFKVDSSPIIVNLNNGQRNIELNPDEYLNLNFYDKTYDPDSKIKDDKTNIQFYFVCIQDPNFQNFTNLISLSKQNALSNNFELDELGFNLAFYSDSNKIAFYEKDCFYNKYTSFSVDNPIYLDVNTKSLQIPAKTLILNTTNSISLHLYANKMGRIGMSQQMLVSANLSNVLTISINADFKEINQMLDKLDDIAQKNPQKALNLLTNFVDVVNTKASDSSNNQTTNATSSASNATSEFSNLRGRMLNTVGTIVGRIDDASSILTAANAAQAVTSNSEQMPTKNQEAGSMVIEMMGEKAKSFGSEDPDLIGNIATSILGATSNTFSAACKTVPVVTENRTNPELLEPVPDVEPVPVPTKYAAPAEFYQCDDCEEFPEDIYESFLVAEEIKFQEEEAVRNQTAEIAKRTFNGISGAGTALATASGNQSNMTKIESKGMALIVGKKNVNDSDDAPTEFKSDNGPAIKMPVLSSVINTSNSSIPPAIQTKMIVSGSNPFQSSKSQAQGTIVSLELTDDFGNPLVINNTQEPFNIKIPAQEPAQDFIASVGLLGLNYHKLYLPSNSSSLHVVIMPEIPGDFYHIYIKYSTAKVIEEYPDEKNYDYAFTSPNSIYLEEGDFEELRYTSFISNNDTKGNGTYYIGVKLAKLSNESAKILNRSNLTEFKSYYRVRIFTTSCKYWKEDTKEWHSDGCFVGEKTTYNMTECLCYHLTTFGTDFYVPPNTIDFSTVFGKFKSLSENAAVFATVISILGVYVLCAIYVRYKDKKDLLKWGATPLADNLPTDNYYYLISVQTGVGKDTGTTSKIGFVLSGDLADSGVRKLSDDKRKAFKSGSVCNFIMSVEEALGSLTYLRIWHDNSGSGRSKSWYLNMVTVLDLQTNQKSNFVLNDWLAVEKGDGQIDRLIPEACQNDLISFKHLFTQSVKKKFTDNHLWFSVFSRPTKSSFTRLQRLSCCMSLLFCTMIANAMFYRSEENASSKSGVMQLGPIKFTITQLYTSIVSTLIVVPVNLVIVTLFRKAKLKHTGIFKPRKTGHIAKQQYWRRVKTIENIELPESPDRSSLFNVNQEPQKSVTDIGVRNRKSIFSKILDKTSNRNIEYKRESREDARNKKQGRTMPHWVIYISWTLVFVSIIVPAFFVILYSMQWGKDRSNSWLTSMFFSFFQSLFVVDPLKVFLITAVITWILRKPDDDDDMLIDSGDPLYNAIVNKDEEYLHNTTSSLSQIDIREIMQSRRSKLTTLKPVDPEELEIQRMERLKAVKFNGLLREAGSYLAFFAVVLFLSYQSRSKNSFFIHTDLSNTFLNNPAMAFEDIQSRPDVWDYIENVFLPGVYAQPWYSGNKLTWREKLTTTNRYSIRVGAPRIRQLRIKENTCTVTPKLANIIDHCRDNYNWVDDDTKDYNIGWIPINGTIGNSSSTTPEANVRLKKSKYKCKNAWCYQNTIQTKSAPIVGAFATYKGGGYAVSLGRSFERSVQLIADLKKEGWIDQLTRAVFLEFTLFNPNVNLFSSATLIVEYLSTGAAITYQSINVFQLYNYLGSYGIIVLIFEIIFVIFIIYFLITEILKIKKDKGHYFKQFWNLNEMVIISLSIVSMAMFGMKTVFTNLAIKAVFESELGEFVNFNTIAMWDDTFNGISAIVVFCSTLKFLKLLRFNKHIGTLAATLKYATKDLIGFSVTFAIIFTAFTQFGLLVFGTMDRNYKDFLTALETVFRFSLGQFSLEELHNSNFFYGSIYFIVFILLVIMGVMSMFVTILNEAYEKVKDDLANQENDFEIIDFFYDRIKKFKNRKANKGGNKKPSAQTMNESTTSLRVNIKQSKPENDHQMYSASFKSLNLNSSLSQYNNQDSLSLY